MFSKLLYATTILLCIQSCNPIDFQTREPTRAVSPTFPPLPSAVPYTPTTSSPMFVSAHTNATKTPTLVPIHFSANAGGGTPPYDYYWDFDNSDGIQVDKNHKSPSFVYGIPGNYAVTLTVKDSRGISSSTQLNITALPKPYKSEKPIRLINIHGTREKPIVIEGLDISAPNDNGIALVNCSYVIIRDNYIHDVNYDDIETGIYGNAIYVQDSSHIEIASNLVTNNLHGIYVSSTPNSPQIEDISIHDNVVTGNRMNNGIHVDGADGVDIGNNHVKDNGDIQFFEHHRIIGIIVWDSTNIKIHDNISNGSTSDGFGIAVSTEFRKTHKGFFCRGIEIYNNTSVENGEQGIWLSTVRDGSVHDNYLARNRNPREDLGSSGIMMEGQVTGLKVFNNNILDNEVTGIGIESSWNNEIYQNRVTSPNSGWGAIWINQTRQPYFEFHTANDNLIRNNILFNSSVGIGIEAGQNNTITNNTIYKNGPHYTGAGGILIMPEAAGTVIKNNIIVWNDGFGILDKSGQSQVAYNDFFQNTANITGINLDVSNIFDDPHFVDAESGNFRLLPNSPCRDTGDPASNFSQESFPNGSLIDMGAYGNIGDW
ncbi:MAG: right-handed parallel beta-helix repeat-containing protein [Chloroflexi bacterium]|nr:right-handed parallel beta-helix repeat-containing protein [Chloroflexota bacterium]